MKTLHIFLGRFSPIHKGHQMIIDKMINAFGIENCLIIIGSSTSLNQRTPFTFEARKKMIKTLYPKIKILGISDINPELEFYDLANLNNWFQQLKLVEINLKRKFIFYGGSRVDVEHLRKRFNANILVNRFKDGLSISATKIRHGLIKGKHTLLPNFLDERIIDIALAEYNKFLKSSN